MKINNQKKTDFNIDVEREYGWSREDLMKPYIEKELNIEIKKYYNQFEVFDYYNDNFEIELKSRRVKHNQYPSTMIGVNKYMKGKKYIEKGKKIFFFFNFTDGLYMFELKKDTILDIKSGGRCDTGIFKDYCYINIADLTRCENQK